MAANRPSSPPSPATSPKEEGDGRRAMLTDSPWFWLLLFSLMGLVTLQVMGQKYGERQAQIEQQYQGRQWSQLQPNTQDREKDEVIQFSSSSDVIIGLRPLQLLAMVLAAVSGAMLLRNMRTAPPQG